MKTHSKVFLFFLCDTVFYMAASFAHPVTPTLFNSLGLGQYMFGVALAAMLAVNFLVSPFWGKINDFASSKAILLISCMGYALGQWFFGSATTEVQFIAARAFTGIFTAGSFVSILTYIVNTSPEEKRGIYLTVHATVQAVAGAFGYFTGGMLGEISVNTAIWAQVITLLGVGVVFFLICEKDTVPSFKEIPLGKLMKESNPFAAFIAGKAFFKGALASVFILSILQSLSSLSFDQSFNYYLRDVFNYSSGYNGIIKGVTGLLSLAVNSTLVIWLMKKGDFNKSLAVIFLACGVIMTASLLIVDPVFFIVGNVAVHVLIVGNVPLLQNLVAQLSSPGKKNLTMGFYNSMKSLGSVFGAMSSGLLYTVDPKMPFIFGIFACALAVIIAAGHQKTLKAGKAVM